MENQALGLLRDVVVGVGAPTTLTLLLEIADDPTSLRPAALLLVLIVAIGAVIGVRCAVIAGATSTVIVWWAFTAPRYSLRIDGYNQLTGVLLFALGVLIAIWLIASLQASQHRAAANRQLFESVVENTPIGLAMFDVSSRFVIVNEALAAINGLPAADHLGRRPCEINPRTAELYEPLLHHVLVTGEAILDHRLSSTIDGVERHWKISYFPIMADDDRSMAVGCTVEDVTLDEVRRRQAELLARFARELSGAVTRDAVAVSTCRFLTDAFSCRSAIAFVERDQSKLVVHPYLSGYDEETRATWAHRIIPIDDATPFAAAARSLTAIHVSSLSEFESTGPTQVTAIMRASGDNSSVWVPVADPDDDARALAVFRMAWPSPDHPTARDGELHDTVASIVALAIRRVELSEAAVLDRFRGALDAMLDAVSITTAVRDASGAIVDFEIVFANTQSLDGAGRNADFLVGGRLCELYPGMRTSALFAAFCDVVETGRPYVADEVFYRDVTDSGPIEGFWNIQAVKFDDGYISSTRDVTALVEARATAAEAKRLLDEHQVTARVVQHAALPHPLPAVDGATISAHHRPIEADQPIGGDWYDVLDLGPQRVGLVIADVAGHGPEAATTMLSVRHVIRAAAAQFEDPADVLTNANFVIRRLGGPGAPFTTCCYAVVDLDRSTLCWSLAGHFAPMLVDDEGAMILTSDVVGPPLGVVENQSFTTTTATFPVGCCVVLFTDGLVERRGEVIDDGLDALVARVREFRDCSGLVDVACLAQSVPSPADDIAVIALLHSS
jgi:PAS domain S-box-containing protein